MVQSLSQCTSLSRLSIALPHDITAFFGLILFLVTLFPGQLSTLDLQLLSYPSCIGPPATAWELLDTTLQAPEYHHLEVVAILAAGVFTKSHTAVWGDIYPYGRYDPVAYRRKIAELLPLVHDRRILFYSNESNGPYGHTERVPGRVRPFLPVEVAERIMDFVAGAETPQAGNIWVEGVPATLVACSLTCRNWRPRAQAHLFRAVALSSTKYEQCNITGFRSLLANHPALGPFIRACTVRDTPSPPAKSPSLHNAPFQLPSMLPQLEHLRLSVGTFYPPPGIAFDACMRRSSSIVGLSLEQVAFYSVNDLRRMVNACRNVTSFRLSNCLWRGKSRPAVAGLRLLTSVRLTEVEVLGEAEWIMDLRSTTFLQWLAHSGALLSAKTIHLPHFIAGAGDMLAASQSALHACHSTLSALHLKLSPDIDYDCCEFTLSQNLLS